MTRRDTWPDWKLERYLLGELPDEQAAALAEELETSDELRDRLDALKASNREILAQYPVAQMSSRIRERARESDSSQTARPKRPRWAYAVAASALLAACAALIVWLGSGSDSPSSITTDAETVRIKGLEPSLKVFRKTPQGARELPPGTRASEGDLLQVGYVASGERHGVIVSLDGAGVVTLHHPQADSRSTELSPSGQHVLDHAYELDDAPAFERFFLVTADRPLDVRRVRQRVAELANRPDLGRSATPELPADIHIHSFLLEKTSVSEDQ